jgi:hypothetical protein
MIRHSGGDHPGVDAGGRLKGVFTVVLLGGRYRNSSGPPAELTLELLDYQLEK